ncbi:MAG: VWA domain-containing protein [Pyrinomonadaceae bacterium]
MRFHLMIAFFIAFASLSFGQTPSASPLPTQPASPEKSKTKTFGASLKKYKNQEQQDFQDNQKRDESDDEAIRVKTDLVVNDVLVADQNGKIINNLTKDDFVVTENGASQTVEMFSPGEDNTVPSSIVLIIDYSSSQFPYLKNSIQAAKRLVDKLNPNDKMAIVTDDVKILIDFTDDKSRLKKTLDSLEMKASQNIQGKSNQFSALLAVLNEMFTVEDRRRIVIFQTDGDETLWLKPDKDISYQISKEIIEKAGIKIKSIKNFGFSDIKEAIERSRATIYSIIPGIQFLGFSEKERLERARISFDLLYRSMVKMDELRGMNESNRTNQQRSNVDSKLLTVEAEKQLADQMAMFKVAELSGGKAGFIQRPEDAETIYSSIFKLISTRYAIGYYSTNQERDGKSREVKIEVRGHPEYIVTMRKTYLPQ